MSFHFYHGPSVFAPDIFGILERKRTYVSFDKITMNRIMRKIVKPALTEGDHGNGRQESEHAWLVDVQLCPS